MNRLPLAKRVQIVSLLVEGCSLRSITRIADVSINTVTRLLVDLGAACAAYQRETLVNLKCRRIQCDEIWSFVYAKQRNIPEEMKGMEGVGDVWTWTAIDADTKLIVSYLVGGRDAEYAKEFMEDVASRLSHKVQLTTDGHKAYLEAVADSFGCYIDYAMLIKQYGSAPGGEVRYSPAQCTGIKKVRVSGNPDPVFISTSYVERQNLTMRMSMRRFTRLTNGFSKKVENHIHAISLNFMYYNFVRVHKTLRVTPAMEAGIANHPWTIEELINLLD
jgi:IS1 family transposase